VLTETELIRKLDFFQPLDQKIIKKIAKMCIVREFTAGDSIVKQGESGLGLYFIIRGRAKVEINRNGTRVVVAELQGGDFLGELSMIDDKARSADVICTEDTNCMLLTRDSFTKLINKYPQIAIQMAKSLVTRIRATNERVSTPSMPSAPAPSAGAASTTLAATPSGALPAAAADAASGNGSLWSQVDPIEFYTSTKGKTRDFLVDTFKSMSALKMMTRFSAAIVGCPVTVQPERRRGEVLQTNIRGVKLALFPSDRNQVFKIDAFADGDFSATVFRPPPRGRAAHASVDRFEGQVRKNEIIRLHVPARRSTKLERL
jgi:CRP-like cAMP-binding protein